MRRLGLLVVAAGRMYVTDALVGDDIHLLLYRKGKKMNVSFKLEPRAIWPIRYMYPQYENVDYWWHGYYGLGACFESFSYSAI